MFKKMKADRKGQALVETALTFPVIILILTGIIDFGLLFNNYLVMSNASREGARSAAVGYTDTSITAMVSGMTATMDQSRLHITITPTESLRKKGDEVTVTIEYDNNLLTPIIGALITQPVRLTAKTVMRVE